MALITIAAAGAGLAVGFATARIIFRPRPQTLELQAATDPRVAEQLRALQMVCGINGMASPRRHTLALDAVEAVRGTLEHLVSGSVLASSIVDVEGGVLASVGDERHVAAMASFSARLGGLGPEVWRVSWRSREGLELVAQRSPISRASRWLVCLASGAPVDRVALSRAAAESGLLEQIEGPSASAVVPLRVSDVRDYPALGRLCDHSPVLAACLWTSGERVFSAGRAKIPDAVLTAQNELQRWAGLVWPELGAALGSHFEVGGESMAFHTVDEQTVLGLVMPGGRPHPWQRITAMAPQLRQPLQMRRAG